MFFISKMDKANYTRRLSIALEKALDAIGVNDKTIELRRHFWLQIERNETAMRSAGDPIYFKSAYCFGSQSEGTTTPEMQSDIDALLCNRDFLVIEHFKHFDRDKICFYLIQDDTTSPGYCLLEQRDKNIKCSLYKRDAKGRYLLLNTAPFMFLDDWYGKKSSREGPASHYISTLNDHTDIVHGLPCKSWPKVIKRNFRELQRSRTWPGVNLVEEMVQSECFVVPTPSKEHPQSDVEWRISFSSAERLLMFSLNLTQIRCYILLKYVKKTIFDVIPKCESTISSYICKATLFHTISQTTSDVWEGDDLLSCLNLCLVVLYDFVSRGSCPHFIFPSNNLLLNRLDLDARISLLGALEELIRNNGQYLYNIKLDNLGHLLTCPSDIGQVAYWKGLRIKADLIENILSHLSTYFLETLWIADLNGTDFTKRYTTNLVKYFVKCTDDKNRNAARVQISLHSSIIGSMMSSNNIQRGQILSDEAFQWLLLGIQYSDVMSTRLKFASALYCSGDLECAGAVLKDMHDYYTCCGDSVISICMCKQVTHFVYLDSEEFMDRMFVPKISTENIINRHVAFCVFFTPSEIHCIPKELQYEMYKTAFSKTDSFVLTNPFTKWMISACISPITYMFFLQYKLYRTLGLEEQRKEVVKRLLTNQDLYQHPETTLNILGQVMENEGNLVIAFDFFRKSLKVERQNNAACILICCNIYKLMKTCKYI